MNIQKMIVMKLLYIDLFCGAGGTSTGVENARYEGQARIRRYAVRKRDTLRH